MFYVYSMNYTVFLIWILEIFIILKKIWKKNYEIKLEFFNFFRIMNSRKNIKNYFT